MYRGFNLSVKESCFKGYEPDGAPAHANQKELVNSTIKAFRDAKGVLRASKLTANWFPQIDAHVFVSHAHKDSDLAIRFAGFLRFEFGIDAFIDSCAWGYADDLLSMIDKEYCWQPESETYDYRKRNRSTGHVHMMLSTAIIRMMNECECVFFLNTPSSISSEGFVGGHTTESPWIFSEVAMTSLIQKRTLSDQRGLVKSMVRADEALQIKYDMDLSHLTNLTVKDMSDWRGGAQGRKGFDALDFLYTLA
jgi:hypothetical protein